MKKEHLKIGIIFFVTVAVVFWVLNFIFRGNAPRSKATVKMMTMSFTPSTVTTTVDNEDFTVSLLAKPSEHTFLRGYKVRVEFDKSKIKFKSIEYKTGVVSAGLGDTTALEPVVNARSSGYVEIIGEDTTTVGSNVTVASGIEIAELTFTALSKDEGSSIVTSNHSWFLINDDYGLFADWANTPGNLIINGGGPTPTVTPPGGPTATPDPNAPTPTSGITDNATLKLKLKFQGIAGKPADGLDKMEVEIYILNESTGVATDKERKVIFTADDKGVWSGETSFDIDTAAKYTVYAKGPYHIKKKICDKTPTETAGGTYKCARGQIAFTAGDNVLDLSGILQLAGDLPEQDGTVSAYDTSLVRNCLAKTTDECKNADVNRDGKVDTQDYSLIIASLSVKNDEE